MPCWCVLHAPTWRGWKIIPLPFNMNEISYARNEIKSLLINRQDCASNISNTSKLDIKWNNSSHISRHYIRDNHVESIVELTVEIVSSYLIGSILNLNFGIVVISSYLYHRIDQFSLSWLMFWQLNSYGDLRSIHFCGSNLKLLYTKHYFHLDIFILIFNYNINPNNLLR